MASPAPDFWATWRRSLPARWRGLVVPYFKAFGLFVLGYGGATALFQPWALGGWWSFGAALLAALGACWGLWRPWGLLARNYKGESRRLPLYFTLLLLVIAGFGLRQVLHARLGMVRDLRDVRELAQPGEATFFRLRGAFYPDKNHRGEYTTTDFTQSKNGTRRYYTTCYYACPLLPAAADTATVPAWLGYTHQEDLGTDLLPGEITWRGTNAVARLDARFDTLALRRFAYLERPEAPAAGLYRAVQASPLAAYSASAEPLLLVPVQASFARRGLGALKLTGGAALLGSALIVLLLLFMDLRLEADLDA
jgi:hypothetical protein